MGNCLKSIGCFKIFQSNWNEGDEFSPAYIRNKPEIGSGGSVDLSGITSAINTINGTLDALAIKDVKLKYSAVHMANRTRGCVNINTSDEKLEITDYVSVLAGMGDMLAGFSIAPADIAWIKGNTTNITYYVVADVSVSGNDKPVYVIASDAEANLWPSQALLVYLGMFYVHNGEVQGLSFCSDDVKVDGVYIYDNPPAVNIVGDATFLGDARGDMNIDTVNKRITIAHDAVVIANNKRYTVPAGNYAWNKGNAASYTESIYTVYAVVLNGSPDTVSLAVMSSSALFVPPAAGTGAAFRIGAFYWTGSAVGGINFGNDVFVDGAYIYGAGGGGDVWTMEFVTASKNWTVPTGCDRIDAFLVGGGGAGAGGGSSSLPGGGGGGGYTVAALGLSVNSGEVLSFEIGAGGLAQASGADGGSGGASRIKRSSVTIAEAPGGSGGRSSDSGGGNGGSGGGAGKGDSGTVGGNGGSDGSDGGTTSDASGGTGQHTSTRCPLNGLLYAGGGGGARYNGGIGGMGGAGGGGNAGHSSSNGGSGSPNTGGGGGGAWTLSSLKGGDGGSGIIVLRYRS